MRGSAAVARHARAPLAALALAGAAALAGTPALAQDARLQVRAVVSRHASIRIAQPPALTLTEADIARGYVEVATPVEVAVQSNVEQGYALLFERRGEQVREVQVRGLEPALVLAEAGVLAPRPGAGRGMWRDTLVLRFRFALSPQARPGQHAWPVQISLMSG